MTQIPPARVGNPTLRDRVLLATSWAVRRWRRLLAAALVLVFIDWRVTHLVIEEADVAFEWAMEDDRPSSWRDYVARGGRRDKARAELRRHHDVARAALRARGAARPDGLDALLGALLEAVDDRVELRAAELTVDAASFAGAAAPPGAQMIDVASRLPTARSFCDQGFSAAFEAATGSKAIVVRDRGMVELDAAGGAPAPVATIDLTWHARASGAVYAGRDQRAFPGFAVTATVTLRIGAQVLATAAASVDPGQTVEYSTDQLGAMFGADDREVVAGMVQAVCSRLGERLVFTMTGLEPLPRATEEKPASADDRCSAGGLANRGACREAAGQVLAAGGDGARFKARYLLEGGCNRNDPDACSSAAELAEGREAMLFRLRACDLGGGTAPACEATRREARTEAKLDRREEVFAVRWGMWLEGTPTSITWIATSAERAAVEARIQAAVAGGRARIYDPHDLPPGVVAPAGARTVYAIRGPEQPVFRDARTCAECGPDDHVDRFHLRLRCTCLPPWPTSP